MEKENQSEWQKISARNRPIDYLGKIQEKHDCANDTDKACGKDNIDEAFLFEAQVEIMDAGETKQ